MKASEYIAKATSSNIATAQTIYGEINALLEKMTKMPPIPLGKDLHTKIASLPTDVKVQLDMLLQKDGWKLYQPILGSREDSHSGDFQLQTI